MTTEEIQKEVDSLLLLTGAAAVNRVNYLSGELQKARQQELAAKKQQAEEAKQ